MEHEVKYESRDGTGDFVLVAGAVAFTAQRQSETTMLQSFEDAIDRLGCVAREAASIVVGNSEYLALMKAGNGRIERLVVVNQDKLDRLINGQLV